MACIYPVLDSKGKSVDKRWYPSADLGNKRLQTLRVVSLTIVVLRPTTPYPSSFGSTIAEQNTFHLNGAGLRSGNAKAAKVVACIHLLDLYASEALVRVTECIAPGLRSADLRRRRTSRTSLTPKSIEPCSLGFTGFSITSANGTSSSISNVAEGVI